MKAVHTQNTMVCASIPVLFYTRFVYAVMRVTVIMYFIFCYTDKLKSYNVFSDTVLWTAKKRSKSAIFVLMILWLTP